MEGGAEQDNRLENAFTTPLMLGISSVIGKMIEYSLNDYGDDWVFQGSGLILKQQQMLDLQPLFRNARMS